MVPARNMMHPHSRYFVALDELLLRNLKAHTLAARYIRLCVVTELSVAPTNSSPQSNLQSTTFLPLQASSADLRAG